MDHTLRENKSVGLHYSRAKIYAVRVTYAADDAHRPPLHGFVAGGVGTILTLRGRTFYESRPMH